MLKRYVLALPVVVLLVGSWGSAPAGQTGSSPRLSGDLLNHPAGAHTHRVIVQTSDTGADSLRSGAFGLLRRELHGASVLDVNDAQLDALQRNPLF